MNWIRRLSILVFLVLLGAGVVVAMGAPDRFRNDETRGEIAFQEDKGITARAEIVNLALAQSDLFDCATYPVGGKPILPVRREIFAVVQDVKVTPKDGNGYLGAVWSPKGDAMVFVVSTPGRRDITDYTPYASDSQTRPVAVGTSKLLLYSPSRNTWEQIAADGVRPVWSADGQSVYYVAGTDLMRFDFAARTAVHTGKSAPSTGIGLLFSRPLSDGRFLAPRGSEASLEVWGSQSPALSGIGVTASDHVSLSPRGDSAILAYSASMSQRQVIPAVTVLRRSDGAVIPLLKNCQNSALKMVWSPSGDRIAYPLHADPPEIRIYDVQSGQTQVVFRNDVYDHLNNLSWSPDGKYLAFTRGDRRGSPAPIWVISTDGAMGQQLVQDGSLANWSPDGKQILYARQDGWYLLKINPTATVSKPVETSTVGTAAPAQRVYTVLCSRVTVPADWLVDAAAGAFATSRPAQGQPDFRIVDGTSTQKPTLEIALSDLKRGALGPRIQSVENWVVDGEPALWATLEPDPQFRYVVMVITPDCGGGRRALFISTGSENRESFESFLQRIHFIR